MSRRMKIIRNIAIGLAALIVVAVATALMVVRTDRFRNYVKEKIITAIQEGTGGATQIGSFAFDATRLHARVTDLVIHGTEPAGSAPFARVARIDIYIQPFGNGRLVGISSLAIDRPQINVIVFPNGHTNLPTPKTSAPSKTTPLETVVDLAVGHFELSGGQLTYNSQPQPLDVRANNLHAQLWYHLLARNYQGQLSLEPIYLVSGRNTPVTLRVTLPVTLERDAIRLHDASIATPGSGIQIDGSMENLRQPKFALQVRGKVTLADLKNAADLPLDTSRRDLPGAIDLEANATGSSDNIRVTALKLAFGHSILEANGALKDPQGRGALKFDGRLALGELARVARLKQRPEGTLALNGEAKMDANGKRLEVKGLRLTAFGGELDADAVLEDFAHYQVSGNLRHLDVRQALAGLGQQRIPYDGVLSGPVHASGDLHAPGTRGLDAGTNLAIGPGRQGIPVQGHLQVDYSGVNDDVRVENSYLALPHSRLTLAGSIRSRLAFSLTTRDLHDLLAAAPSSTPPPVTLQGGQVSFTGAITGTLTAPHVAGHLAADHFQVEGRQFDKLAADLAASGSGAAVTNGALTRGAMLAAFSGTVVLRDWSPTPSEPVAADATLQNGDLADIMALAGQPNQEYAGALTANLHVAGTVGNPGGTATIHAASGTLRGEPFDRLDAQINLADRLATIPSASFVSGNARVDLTAEFQHPHESFTTGRLHAHLQSNRIDLAQLRTVSKQAPDTSGQLQLSADITGELGAQSKFLITNVQADASGRAIRFEGEPYGDFTLHARTSGQTTTVDVTSDFAGSNLLVHGNTRLVDSYPTTADVQVNGLAIERVLAVAHRTDIPARGTLSATAHVRGTLDNPEGDATLDFTKGVVYDEPVDHMQVRVNYTARRIDVPQLEISAGPSRLALNARFDHPAGSFDSGDLEFRVENSRLDFGRLRNVQKVRPGLAGSVQLSADGSAAMRTQSPRIVISSLNANVATTNLAGDGKSLGNFTLAAHTTSGNRLDFTLNSDLAGASLQAHGNGRLGDDYPIDAQVTFSNVKWTRVQALLGPSGGGTPSFEAIAEGKVMVNGPVLQTDRLRGSLELAKLQVQTQPQPGTGKSITIQNQGPVTATLDRGTVTLTGFHFTGPQTDVQASGTVAVPTQKLNVSVNAGIDLGVLRNFSRDITSSGSVKLAANVRGTFSDPVTDGSLELHNANLNYATVPNGLGNANGVVVFRGNRATVQNLTAESGGGKITLSGFASMSGNFRFALRANAARVRVRLQEGVSVMADADVHLAGTSESSTATGTITLDQLNYSPHSDIGAMLERATPPVESSTNPSPLLDNMKLDIRVHTSPAMQVRSSLAQNLQTDADVRIRGTASQPAVLGRVTLTRGELAFFGSTYTVNSGSISFFNPARIEPILNLSLETKTKGVDVVLNVTGPVDNMKLSYTSDPPLQFQEIVGLLFTGTTPTSDPTLLANQPSPPPQTLGQRGESAILSQAVASPVASQLERVFGVTQLKIDPSFTGASQLPTAQLTLQQQISSNMTFTYVSALDNPNSTLIRADWALNQQWSAMAVRDQNGIFSINLLYKKQFR